MSGFGPSDKKPFEDLPHECSDALQVMYSFIDGELPVEQVTVVRQHIESCVDCFEAFDFEAEVKLMVRNKCQDSPPADLKDRIERLCAEAANQEDQPPNS
jgi:mycothiol system anti-sigma-R factor